MHCLRLANLMLPGLQRDRVRDMAYEWVRLANEQQDGVTHLDEE